MIMDSPRIKRLCSDGDDLELFELDIRDLGAAVNCMGQGG